MYLYKKGIECMKWPFSSIISICWECLVLHESQSIFTRYDAKKSYWASHHHLEYAKSSILFFLFWFCCINVTIRAVIGLLMKKLTNYLVNWEHVFSTKFRRGFTSLVHSFKTLLLYKVLILSSRRVSFTHNGWQWRNLSSEYRATSEKCSIMFHI